MKAQTAVRHLQRAVRQSFSSYHAPFRITQPVQRQLYLQSRATPHLRRWPQTARIAQQLRSESTEAYRPLTDRSPESSKSGSTTEADEIAARKAQEPAYEITFTCRKCLERSSHRITKQAYHFGTTLITCPGCKNRHLISDHLKVFSDKSITIEDILKEKGQFLRKGRLGDDGDIEFYDEGNNEIGRMMADKHRKEGG